MSMTDQDGYSVSPVPPQNSNLAVISLVSGIICWFMFPVLGAIVAVITGNMAKKEIIASGGTLAGEGLAQFGIVSGWAHLVLSTIIILCFGAFFFIPFILAFLGIAIDGMSALPAVIGNFVF